MSVCLITILATRCWSTMLELGIIDSELENEKSGHC